MNAVARYLAWPVESLFFGPASAGFVNAGLVSAASKSPPKSEHTASHENSFQRISDSPVVEDIARVHRLSRLTQREVLCPPAVAKATDFSPLFSSPALALGYS